MVSLLTASIALLISFQFLHVSQATVSRCLVCNSTEEGCAEGWPTHVQDCTAENDGCFTRIANEVLFRGCRADLRLSEEQLRCTEEEGRPCISCTSNECNDESWLKCTHCNRDDPKGCSDRSEVSFCPQYRSTDRCYEMVTPTGLGESFTSSGCESTLTLRGYSCDDADECTIIVEPKVKHRITEIMKTSLQCLVCSSSDEAGEECVKGTSMPKNCPQEDDVCFSRVHENSLERNCLSTLTPEEQKACSGEDGACVTCKEAGCNNDPLLRCIQCKKSLNHECVDPIISSTLDPYFCPLFQPVTRCFSRIVEDDLERGCSSGPEDICTGNKHCLSCDTDGCNMESESFLLDVAKCLRCQSHNGDNVPCEEASVGSEECEKQEDECFTRIQDGTMERNCLSILSDEDQRKCRDEEDNTCVTCSSHDCNHLPWLRCYRCTSQLDPRCVNPVDNDLLFTFCAGFESNDRCYARIVDQHVQRGCEIDLGADVDACEGNSMCFVCYGDGCNSLDEDMLGKLAKCITCSSEVDGEACEKANMEAEQCEKPDDECFTRVVDGNLQRGCLSTLLEEDQDQCLDQSDSSCVTCQDPSCNQGTWLKCLKCKTSEHPDCAELAETPLQDITSFCSNHNDQASCYSRISAGDLERGCSLDLETPGDVCSGNKACETCQTDSCNTHPEDYLIGGISCVKCTSNDKDTDCNGNLPELLACAEQNDQCFTRVDGGTLTRDCLSSLKEEDRQACTNPTDLSCIVCDESGCNQNRWRMCHQCDGATSLTCGNEQTNHDASFCKFFKSKDECYTKIDQDQRFSRGCLSDAGPDVDLCAGAELCLTCKCDFCNKLPESSLVHAKCQQCTSASEDCVLGTAESKPCPLKNDLCYSTVNSDNLLERGCLSTLSESLQAVCEDASNPSCIACSESGCNSLHWPRCYRCRSSESDNACDSSLTPQQLEFCPSYNESPLCYSAIEQGEVIRDCTNEAESVCDGNSRCVACKDEGCNNLPKESLETVHSCYQCRSKDGDCDTFEGPGEECAGPSNRCYTKLDGESRLSRGCLADIDADECEKDANCLICSGKDCNILAWPKCFQCSNATSNECASKQVDREPLKYCQQYAEKSDCYAMITEMEFIRGCASDLEESVCDDPENCIQCSGKGCNLGSLKSYFHPAFCLRCHSDLDSGCMDGIIPPVACKDPDDICFYRRASLKAIHRGCLSDLASINQNLCLSSTKQSCHTCDGNGCNSRKWRRCFQCSSLIEAECAVQQLETKFLGFCLKVDDYCFEDRDGAEIRRGCGRYYCAHKMTCVECSSDACNDRSGSALLPSHCLVCDSTDPLCADGSRIDQYCNYLDEPCFSMVRNDGVLERGCFSFLYEPYKTKCLDEADHTCKICQSNSCNRDPWRQCVQCRSLEVDHFCSRDSSVLKSHYCSRFQNNDRCYAKDVGGIVTRGCGSDSNSTEDLCEGLSKKNCYTCTADHCNAKSLNGVGRVPHQSMRMYVAVVVVALWQRAIQCLLS